MNEKEMIFYMESRHEAELTPLEKITDSEAELYESDGNDDRDYSQNSTAWD